MNKEHELKCWPEFYQDVESGVKPFEMRKNDREYNAGDILHIREWHNESEEYSGRSCKKRVTYILSYNLFNAVPKDFVIMGLETMKDEQKETPKVTAVWKHVAAYLFIPSSRHLRYIHK